jgi:hypothetical protein
MTRTDEIGHRRLAGVAIEPARRSRRASRQLCALCQRLCHPARVSAAIRPRRSDLTRPLMATRITPEYSGMISYFRNLYP